MTRQIVHRQVTARGCSCGARFKEPRELRKHITSSRKQEGKQQ